MKTIARTTRLERLAALVKDAGGNAAFARRHQGIDPTYVSQLLNGHRSFGESAARKMEGQMGKPEGWLDRPLDDDDIATDGSGSGSPDIPAMNTLSASQSQSSGGGMASTDERSMTQFQHMAAGRNRPTVAIQALSPECVSNNKHTIPGFAVSGLQLDREWLTHKFGLTPFDMMRVSAASILAASGLFAPDDILLIDTSETTITRDDVYLYEMQGGLRAAFFQLANAAGDFKVSTGRSELQTSIVPADLPGMRIIGRVLCSWRFGPAW